MTRIPGESSEGSPWVDGKWVADWPTTISYTLTSVADLTKNAEVWVMHPDFPGWRFFLTFSPAGTPVGFRVEADKGLDMDHQRRFGDPAFAENAHAPGAPPITARFLRNLPLGEIQDAARHAVLRSAALDDEEAGPDVARLGDHWKRTFDESRKPGRRGRDDLFYAELAAEYVHRAERSGRPVEEIAAEKGYNASAIRNLLYVARRRGLLTGAPAGRSGGALTKKAIRVLDREV